VGRQNCKHTVLPHKRVHGPKTCLRNDVVNANDRTFIVDAAERGPSRTGIVQRAKYAVLQQKTMKTGPVWAAVAAYDSSFFIDTSEACRTGPGEGNDIEFSMRDNKSLCTRTVPS
jgi:hypothetical protein